MRTAHPDFLSDPLPFFQVSPEKFDAVWETNLRGWFLVSRSLHPSLSTNGSRF